MPQALSRADAEDHFRSASYAKGEYVSTSQVRLPALGKAGGDVVSLPPVCVTQATAPSVASQVKYALDLADGDIDRALKTAGLPPRKPPLSPLKSFKNVVGIPSSRTKQGNNLAYQRLEEGETPPPVKIQRSGSAHFHVASYNEPKPTYPTDPAYHAAVLRNGVCTAGFEPAAARNPLIVRLRPGGGQFIRKVYGILSVQMIVTVLIAITMMYTPSIRDFCLNNAGLIVWPVLILSLVVVVALSYTKDTYPLNYGLLAGFTIIESILVGFVCTVYMVAGMGDVVVEAFVLTASLFLVLSLYACQSKRNFEFLHAGLFGTL